MIANAARDRTHSELRMASVPVTQPSRDVYGTSSAVVYVFMQNKVSNEFMLSSYSLGHREAFEELKSVYRECSTENWDGYSALPVSEATYKHAVQFLLALPFGSRSPTVGAEPDGHFTFEWYMSPRRILSVSISPEGVLHYAALIGINKARGSESFLGTVPKPIHDLIQRIYS